MNDQASTTFAYMSKEGLVRRAARIVAVVAFSNLVLIATHHGEFWPFSTFSMFASAGRPWQRALVRVEATGTTLPLGEHGISQNDLSSLVQGAEHWGEADREALRQMFGPLPCANPLLVLRVRGTLESGELHEELTPVARLQCEESLPIVESLLPPESRMAELGTSGTPEGHR